MKVLFTVKQDGCASRAFWLAAYSGEGHEMLFDAHAQCLTGLGGVASTTT